MNNKYIGLAIALACILLALGGFIGYTSAPKPIVHEFRDTLIQIDTQYRYIQKDSITIKIRAKKVTDTLINNIPYYVSKADTIIKKDTFYLGYNSLTNLFDLNVHYGRDTIKLFDTTRTVPVYIDKTTPWWKDALYFIGGFGVSSLIQGLHK